MYNRNLKLILESWRVFVAYLIEVFLYEMIHAMLLHVVHDIGVLGLYICLVPVKGGS